MKRTFGLCAMAASCRLIAGEQIESQGTGSFIFVVWDRKIRASAFAQIGAKLLHGKTCRRLWLLDSGIFDNGGQLGDLQIPFKNRLGLQLRPQNS